TLLSSIVADPAMKVGGLKMLSVSEEKTLLTAFNNTNSKLAHDKCIIELFENRVSESPDAVAVVYEGRTLSYEDLNSRSNQLARYLLHSGLAAEALVPICVERGLEMVIGILGILKAGYAYVPIDPEYPQDRISYMLEDSGAPLILSSRLSRSKITSAGKIDIIELDDWNQIDGELTTNTNIRLLPN